MAEFFKLDWNDPDFLEWFNARPPAVQDMIRKWPPNKLYKIRGTGNRVYLQSYTEDGGCTVGISGDFNLCMFERNVFGVKLDELVECDLPGPDEPCRAMVKDKEDIDRLTEIQRKHMGDPAYDWSSDPEMQEFVRSISHKWAITKECRMQFRQAKPLRKPVKTFGNVGKRNPLPMKKRVEKKLNKRDR